MIETFELVMDYLMSNAWTWPFVFICGMWMAIQLDKCS